MPWFPTGENDSQGWRLDVVSLLAVVGENSMEAHYQAITASWTCILPRLVPAPQALLKPSRPKRMPTSDANIVGISNGTLMPQLNYFPNIIHPLEDIPRFGFKILRITHAHDKAQKSSPEVHSPNKEAISSSVQIGVLENGGTFPTHRPNKIRGLAQNISGPQDGVKPTIPPQTFSPLNILSVGSFVLTIGLLIAAALLQDGTAMAAIATISTASSLVGYASWWKPTLTKRTFKTAVPPGDVVVLKREGAFLLVRCNEEVARELYTGPDLCTYYVRTQQYRILVGCGTVLLMVSVVLLGNCNFAMQAAIGISYILLNGLYWGVALIKKHHFWDLSRYTWVDETPEDAKSAEISTGDTTLEHASYTRSLWYVIRDAKSIDWVNTSGASPKSKDWDTWLTLAEKNAIEGNRNWDAAAALGEILRAAAAGKTEELREKLSAAQDGPFAAEGGHVDDDMES